MDRLSYDLIFEILSWLPPKSILDSKTVSKQWYEIISSKSFRSRYRSNVTKNPTQCSQIIGFIPLYTNRLYSPNSTHPIPAQIVAASNGLLLTLGCRSTYSIYNPVTGEDPLSLPYQDDIIRGEVALGFSVVFTDAISPHTTTATTNHPPFKFEIVLQLRRADQVSVRFRTFSSDTWSWSPVQTQLLCPSDSNLMIKPYQNAVVSNRTYYWLNGAASILKYGPHDEPRMIADFIRLPSANRQPNYSSDSDAMLGVTIDGLLQYLLCAGHSIRVMVRVVDGGGGVWPVWVLRHNVNLMVLSKQLPPDVMMNKVSGGGNYVRLAALDPMNPSAVYLESGRDVLVYDQEFGSLKVVGVPECRGLVRFPGTEGRSQPATFLPYFSSTWAADFVFDRNKA